MASTVEFEVSEHVIRVNPRNPDSILERCPAGVYKVKLHPKLGILLPKVSDRYALPPQVFGTKSKRACDLIWSAFQRREGILGALTTGLKGSGKTLLSELLGNRCIDDGMPVFIIDDSENVDKDTIEFVAKHCEPCMFIFDEFAKVFKDEKQNEMLTFFSGSGFTKVLCLMAENEIRTVNEYLLNRPGRMMFHLRYDSVTPEEAREVCLAYNVNEDITKEIEQYVGVADVSMDILRTIARESALCKTVDEFKELFAVLNIPKMEYFEYKVEVGGDRESQFSLQREFTYKLRTIAPAVIEVTRIRNNDQDTLVENWNPLRETSYKLQGWTAMRVTTTKVTTPPEIGKELKVKWEYDLKEHEEREAKWKEKTSGGEVDPKRSPVSLARPPMPMSPEGTIPF